MALPLEIDLQGKSLAELSELEWLETNGLGGYAASSVCGSNTRRYHGLLVAAANSPAERRVLISKIDETVHSSNGSFNLGTRHFPGASHPEGYRLLASVSKGGYTKFCYGIGSGELHKSIYCSNGSNTTLIKYDNRTEAPLEIELELFVAFRDIHSLGGKEAKVSKLANGLYKIQSGQEFCLLYAPDSRFIDKPLWHHQFEYPQEIARGFDGHEDLFSPGSLNVQVEANHGYLIALSTEEIAPTWEPNSDSNLLQLASGQFLVKRGGDGLSIIAGYPWFADWTRDSMISLPGLTLSQGRMEQAQKILTTFAEHCSEGMLPNRFAAKDIEYNNVDGTLWFFVSLFEYFQATGDKETLVSIRPVVREIIQSHLRGTRYNIHADKEGALHAGDSSTQLTWMDARIGDKPVTPRGGTCVEVNALWYNACRVAAVVEEGEFSLRCAALANKTARTFEKLFWNGRFLNDYINSDEVSSSIRPNQLFAFSLPFPLLREEQATSVLDIVEEHLVTNFGLRTLSPSDPAYIPHYRGSPQERDAAYHQGTVWPWLIGPYARAVKRTPRARSVEVLGKMVEQLSCDLERGCIGSVAEVYDGSIPKGCLAQAWSVAELVVAKEILKEL